MHPEFERWDKRSYLARLGDVTSQFFNVLLFNGMTDESISGRSFKNTYLKKKLNEYVATRWLVLNWVSNLVFFWQKDHTRLAYVEDIYRSQLRAKHITVASKAWHIEL